MLQVSRAGVVPTVRDILLISMMIMTMRKVGLVGIFNCSCSSIPTLHCFLGHRGSGGGVGSDSSDCGGDGDCGGYGDCGDDGDGGIRGDSEGGVCS